MKKILFSIIAILMISGVALASNTFYKNGKWITHTEDCQTYFNDTNMMGKAGSVEGTSSCSCKDGFKLNTSGNKCLPKGGITTSTPSEENQSNYNPSNSNDKLKGERCSQPLILNQNLRAPRYGERYIKNGKYDWYTKSIVKEAHILQKHLNRLNFSAGKVDGIIGPKTRGAILRLQKYLGTTQDGYVGPKTRELLNNSCNGAFVEGDYKENSVNVLYNGYKTKDDIKEDLKKFKKEKKNIYIDVEREKNKLKFSNTKKAKFKFSKNSGSTKRVFDLNNDNDRIIVAVQVRGRDALDKDINSEQNKTKSDIFSRIYATFFSGHTKKEWLDDSKDKNGIGQSFKKEYNVDIMNLRVGDELEIYEGKNSSDSFVFLKVIGYSQNDGKYLEGEKGMNIGSAKFGERNIEGDIGTWDTKVYDRYGKLTRIYYGQINMKVYGLYAFKANDLYLLINGIKYKIKGNYQWFDSTLQVSGLFNTDKNNHINYSGYNTVQIVNKKTGKKSNVFRFYNNSLNPYDVKKEIENANLNIKIKSIYVDQSEKEIIVTVSGRKGEQDNILYMRINNYTIPISYVTFDGETKENIDIADIKNKLIDGKNKIEILSANKKVLDIDYFNYSKRKEISEKIIKEKLSNSDQIVDNTFVLPIQDGEIVVYKVSRNRHGANEVERIIIKNQDGRINFDKKIISGFWRLTSIDSMFYDKVWSEILILGSDVNGNNVIYTTDLNGKYWNKYNVPVGINQHGDVYKDSHNRYAIVYGNTTGIENDLYIIRNKKLSSYGWSDPEHLSYDENTEFSPSHLMKKDNNSELIAYINYKDNFEKSGVSILSGSGEDFVEGWDIKTKVDVNTKPKLVEIDNDIYLIYGKNSAIYQSKLINGEFSTPRVLISNKDTVFFEDAIYDSELGLLVFYVSDGDKFRDLYVSGDL